MVKSVRILMLSLCIASFSFGQNDYVNYNLKVYQAMKLNYENKLDSALLYYKQAFELVDYIHGINLMNAYNLAKELNDEAMIDYTLGKYNQRKSIKRNEFYRNIIDSLHTEDQRVRGPKYYEAKSIYRKYDEDSLLSRDTEEFMNAQKLCQEWLYVDSLNIKMLLTLIDEYGFPSEKLVGQEAYKTQALLILIHFDNDKYNVVLKPIIDKALQEGEIEPEDYAWIVDRRLSWGQGLDPYYYQEPFDWGTLTDAEINEINDRRKKIGLRKLFEGVKIINMGDSFYEERLY